MNAIADNNRAAAVDFIKSMMSDKAYDYVDAQREAVAKQVFGAVVGADAEAEIEPETTEEQEQPEEEEDETDHGDD